MKCSAAQQRVSSASLVAPAQPASPAPDIAQPSSRQQLLAEGHACKPVHASGRLDNNAKAYAPELFNQHQPVDGQAAKERINEQIALQIEIAP